MRDNWSRASRAHFGTICRAVTASMVTILSCLAITLGVAAADASAFCKQKVLVDYAEVLEGMPSDRLPGQHRLPFGPADLRLRAGRSVTVEGEPISFTLDLDRPVSGDGRVERVANLDWAIKVTLDPVTRLGHPLGVPRQRRWRVRQLRYPERRFDIPANAGLYRVSVTIRKIGGQTFASYRQFIRVLPLRDKIGIGIRGGETYRPGETVVAHVENRGTREALFPTGLGLVTERLEGGTWVKAETDEGAPSVMFEDPEFLLAGRASGCSYFTIPSNTMSASFRFSVVALIGPGEKRRVVRTFAVGVAISTLFGVTPAGGAGLARHSTFCGARGPSQSAGGGLRLAISKKRVSPFGGSPLMVRLENGGTETFSYALLYRLDHFEGGAWTRVPTGPVFSPRLMLYGESTGECEEVSPTQKLSPGWYRVSKSVRAVGARSAKAREVRATFKVGGP